MKNSEEQKDQFDLELKKESSLLQSIMELETKIKHLEQETKKHQKEIRNIEKSTTWKYSIPLRKLNNLLFKSNENDVYQYELLTSTETLKDELAYLKEQVEKQQHTQFFSKMKQAKNNGEIFHCLDELIRQKKENDLYYEKAFKYIANLFKSEQPDYKKLVYNKLLTGMSIDQVPEMLIRACDASDSIQLDLKPSFQASLYLRARRRQLGELLPEWILDKKEHGYKFIDILGVKRPWTSTLSFKISDMERKKEIVIKPVDGAGSRGVYLVLDFNRILDMKRQKTLESWEQLLESMKQDIALGWVNHDEWFMEELIHTNEDDFFSSDIKFYCFYGEIALILEIIRYPELKYCWWTANGDRFRTGKYDEDLYKGQGVSKDEIELASQISMKIPSPFIRIDFLRSENGLVFGEFTPKPGNYDEFDRNIDRQLGNYYLEAEGRLINDLLNGKQFKQYKQLISK